jgi:1-acyl-sn-glycerol-3-phosphate acyltransferase
MNHEAGIPLVYRAFRAAGAPFRFRVVGLENVESAGPAIYAGNHLGSLGPIQAVLSVPVRFYPWVVAEMTDPARARQYLYDDFVGPELRLHGRGGIALATAISWISVRLLNSAGAIPMDSNRGRIIDAFRRSLDLLAQGKNLLIFPENTAEPIEPATGMHPFKCGFAELCWIRQQATGERVPVYPMAVHPSSRTLAIGKAMFIPHGGARRGDLRAACIALSQEIRELYVGLSAASSGM